MTRMEKRQLRKKEKTLQAVNLLLIFVAIATTTFAYMVNNENNKLKEKIDKYDPDVKVFYLQQEIDGGKY